MPAECDVPLRPGWFYHKSQDGKSKSAAELLSLYYKSVGRGACLDLGISPNQNGMLPDDEVETLREFGTILRNTFNTNLAKGATLKVSNVRGGNATVYGPQKLLDNNRYSYWATDNGAKTAELIINMHHNKIFNIIRLREDIKLGQRIDSVAVDSWQAGKWHQIATATSIGANRLIRLPQDVTTIKVRLRIIKSEACIALSDFGLYKEAMDKPPILNKID